MAEQEPSTSDMETYLGRVQALLIAAGEVISDGDLANAQRLVEHGEPPEGLCALAWVISNGQHRVPSWIIEGIRELTDESVEAAHMPADLGRLAED